VNQREVHADTHSFSNSLRAALREDPDVVLIGERDLETIESALRNRGNRPLDFCHLAPIPRHPHQPHHRRFFLPISNRKSCRELSWSSKGFFARPFCRALTAEAGHGDGSPHPHPCHP